MLRGGGEDLRSWIACGCCGEVKVLGGLLMALGEGGGGDPK